MNFIFYNFKSTIKHKPLTFQQKFILIILSILTGALLFFLSYELYKSNLLNDKIEQAKLNNIKIKEDIKLIKNKYEYFNTDNYKDKYAKEIFNKVNDGEKVLIINNFIQQNIKEAILNTNSILDEWKEYFFGKDTIEDRINNY